MTTMKQSDADSDAQFECGQFVVDTVHDKKCLVLKVTDTPASEYKIPELGNRTVAKSMHNRDFPPNSPVTLVAYTDSLSDKLGVSWDAPQVCELYEETEFDDLSLKDYAMPSARLEAVVLSDSE